MSRRKPSRRRDLRVVAGLALLGMILSFLPWGGWLAGAALLPLVLLLPGYALVAALFTTEDLPVEEQLLLAVVFSIAAAAIGGVVIQLVIPLDRAVWGVLLALVTVTAATAASSRRSDAAISLVSPRLRLPGVRPVAALGLVAAVLLTAAAISIAAQGVHDQQRRQLFASVWIVREGPRATGPVTIGVWNHGPGGDRYRLALRQSGSAIRRWPLDLASNERWQRRIDITMVPGADPVRLLLYRDGFPYRSAELQAAPRP